MVFKLYSSSNEQWNSAIRTIYTKNEITIKGVEKEGGDSEKYLAINQLKKISDQIKYMSKFNAKMLQALQKNE